MAILKMDSFDLYPTAGGLAQAKTYWGAAFDQGTNSKVDSTMGRWGGGAFYGAYVEMTDATTYYMAFHFKWLASGMMFGVLSPSGAAWQLYFDLNGDGSISVYRGNKATLLGSTAAGVLTGGAYTHLAFKIVCDQTTGYIEIRTADTVLLTFSGNTRASGTGATGRMGQFRFTGGSLGGNGWFDDLIYWDESGSTNNTWLGEHRISALRPTAAGASAQFTPTGAASNYQCVDDTTENDDTDYNVSSTINNIDTFVTSDLSFTPAVIFAVSQRMVAAMDDGAGTRTVAGVYRTSGGTNYVGPNANVSVSTYAHKTSVWEVDPSTGTAWAAADINGGQFGYKQIA